MHQTLLLTEWKPYEKCLLLGLSMPVHLLKSSVKAQDLSGRGRGERPACVLEVLGCL